MLLLKAHRLVHSNAQRLIRLLVAPVDLLLLEAKDHCTTSQPGQTPEQPVYFVDNYPPVSLSLTDAVRGYITEGVSGRIKSRSVNALCKRFNGLSYNSNDIALLQLPIRLSSG